MFCFSRGYYQNMRQHKLLREAMGNLHTFEQWHLERNDDAQFSGLSDDLQNICDIPSTVRNNGLLASFWVPCPNYAIR